MEEPLEIREHLEDGQQVVELHGELDLSAVEQLRNRVRGLVCAERETVLDLSGLTFIDSSGIQVLFEVSSEAKENGGRLRLRAPSRVAYETLRLAGVLELLGLDD